MSYVPFPLYISYYNIFKKNAFYKIAVIINDEMILEGTACYAISDGEIPIAKLLPMSIRFFVIILVL